ncbi:hypothetical protein B5181_43020, partial [Streptomyces sp. 4F]
LVARTRALSWDVVITDGDQAGEDSGDARSAGPELWDALDALQREADQLLEKRIAAHDETGADPGPLPAAAPAEGSATAEKYLTVLHCRVFAAYHVALAGTPEIPAPDRERFDALRATLESE